jgi:lipid-binding SYLF domain-containing protein
VVEGEPGQAVARTAGEAGLAFLVGSSLSWRAWGSPKHQPGLEFSRFPHDGETAPVEFDGNGSNSAALLLWRRREFGARTPQDWNSEMNLSRRSLAAGAVALASTFGPLAALSAHADPRADLADAGVSALHRLEATEPRSRFFAHHAKAVLIFPSVLKAGFVFGGESGNGVLLVNGEPAGFYNLTGGSWGLQIGGQDFSYALFFMTNSSLDYLRQSGGFSAGTGPSIVVINQGAGAEANTTTLTHDVYAFPFNQKGLMADLTLQGTKISRIHPH